MQFAVFIEPQDELRESIITLKKNVEFNFSSQPYCSHPPHCTLIHVPLTNEIAAISCIRKALKNLDSFEVRIDQTGVFWNDPATGGHTLYLKINTEERLQNLQICIAEAIKKLIQKECRLSLL